MAALLACAACEGSLDREPRQLEPWRAETVLGAAAALEPGSRDGPILPSREARASVGAIYPGGRPLGRDIVGVSADDDGAQVSLNLVQVPIAEAAEAVLAGLFGQSYLIDPRVQGTVDIRSSRPIGRRTAFEIFELALKQNGAALVRRDDVFAIVPLGTELGIGIDTQTRIQPGFSIRAVPLRHIGAAEMATILSPIAGAGIVAVDERRNLLVLAGSSVDQVAWAGTIANFDVDWLANRPVGVFPIRGRSARSVVRGLELLVDAEEGMQPLALFEVIPENNSILAVARTPEALSSVALWVRRLTQEGQNDARVYSYDMRHARASEVAGVLGEILGIAVQVPGSARAGTGASVPSGTGAFGPAAAFPLAPSMLAATAQAQVPAAFDPMLVDGALPPGQRIGPEGTANATRIVASEATNTLLIHATPAEYERVLGVLDRLDVPPRQVLVEATIIEVTLNDTLRYGVQYFFESGGSDFILSVDPAFNITPTLPGFAAVINTPANVVIDALDDLTEINVISSPNMMVLNNQSARLSVGATVPVAIRTAQDPLEGNTEVFASEIEFRDTGVIFEVTPRINSSGAVVLDIRQEVSNVLEPDAETLTPTISQRLLQSSVAVASGETVALGGLFSSEETRGRSGIPLLVDIPIAGALFGTRSSSRIRTELLVLITPRIVNSSIDARQVTRSLRERVTAVALSDAALSTAITAPELRSDHGQFLDTLLWTGRYGGRAPSTEPAQAPAATPAGGFPTEPRASASPPPEALPAPAAAASLDPRPGPAPTAPGRADPVALRLTGPTQGDAYAVLGSFRDRDGPQRQWASLLAREAALAGLTPAFYAAGGLHRVAVGPMSQSEAAALCARLSAECFVETARAR